MSLQSEATRVVRHTWSAPVREGEKIITLTCKTCGDMVRMGDVADPVAMADSIAPECK